jgi:hypothetical protein
MKRLAIVLAVALGAVAAVGGYSFGATTSKPAATICATARNVPSHVYARSATCPRGQHAIRWSTAAPSAAASYVTVSAN